MDDDDLGPPDTTSWRLKDTSPFGDNLSGFTVNLTLNQSWLATSTTQQRVIGSSLFEVRRALFSPPRGGVVRKGARRGRRGTRTEGHASARRTLRAQQVARTRGDGRRIASTGVGS
eukprot:664699-Prorocentrum_minimum.AAC.1